MMEDIKSLKILFREREEYTVFFVPFFLSETGILFEFHKAKPEAVEEGFSVQIKSLEKFGKDLIEATKKRYAKLLFPSDPKPAKKA